MSGRYAMNEKAEALSMDAFFELVNQKAITQEQLQNLSVKPLKQKKTTFDGPPCIEILQNMGIFEGKYLLNLIFAHGQMLNKFGA